MAHIYYYLKYYFLFLNTKSIFIILISLIILKKKYNNRIEKQNFNELYLYGFIISTTTKLIFLLIFINLKFYLCMH